MLALQAVLGLPGMLRSAFLTDKRNPDSGFNLVELRAHGSLLPVLTRQLQDASTDMESEVSKVCKSFQGMARRATESIRNASAVLATGDSECEMGAVIQGCRETMLTLLDRMERSEARSRSAIEHMERVERSVAQVSHALKELDRSAFSNKLVALNAKIEAVHLGEAGKGFEVVAEEISLQAGRSTELTFKVGEVLGLLVTDAREAIGELRSVSEADRQWRDTSRGEVNGLLGKMEQANGELRTSLEENSAQSRHLASDIEAALVTLQFQDRVSQRIAHVTASLEAIHRAVSTNQGAEEGASLSERRREIEAQMTSAYTMDCERNVHAGSVAPKEAGSNDTDVELF